MIKAVFIVLFSSLHSAKCQVHQLTPFIVEGEDSDIRDFPHSASISVHTEDVNYGCGSSILNQRILLTATHCLIGIDPSKILIQYGHAQLPRTKKMYAVATKLHPNYVERDITADIGLVKTLEPLKFHINVRRIAIFPAENTPYDEETYVAGWGRIDEILEISTDRLKHIRQHILDHDRCEHIMSKGLPEGTICGYNTNEKSYASSGDSGSALVVRHFIQVGLVSAKKPEISRSIVIYTDIGFYYNWIIENTSMLLCSENAVEIM